VAAGLLISRYSSGRAETRAFVVPYPLVALDNLILNNQLNRMKTQRPQPQERRNNDFSEQSASPPISRQTAAMADEFFCEVCGALAEYGFGVSLKRNVRGRWYCAEHRVAQQPSAWIAGP
jgi:hypothetical protein